MHVLTAAVRGYAAIIANEIADPGNRDTEALVALASPDQFPCLSEAAAQPRQDTQAAFEFGLRAIASGLLYSGKLRAGAGIDQARTVGSPEKAV
jgi:hypothetical protein